MARRDLALPHLVRGSGVRTFEMLYQPLVVAA